MTPYFRSVDPCALDYVNLTYLVLIHPQLKFGLEIKPPRVAHGHIAEAISLLPGLHPQSGLKHKTSFRFDIYCLREGKAF